MKKIASSIKARVTLGTLFVLSSILLLCAIPLLAGPHASVHTRAQKPSVPNLPSPPIPFSGTYDPNVYPCASPKNGPFTVPIGQTRIVVQTSATLATNDITVTLLFGAGANPAFVQTEDTLTSTEALVYAPSGGVPAGVYQVQICQTTSTNGVPQMAPFTYNGTFTTDDTPQPGGGGAAPPPFGSIPAAVPDSGPQIGFENFIAPGVLVPVTTTSAGGQVNSVEWMGRNAGEPSIGNNWLTDVTAFFSDL